MPADALTYSLCASELNDILSGGRINKITMPLPDTINISIRSKGKNHNLLLSANPSSPRLHLTNNTLTNPEVAPSFLMHLRKHIGSGSIEGVFATPFERIVSIKIKAYNELMIAQTKSLIIEIMGKHSNIILVNENGIISDSIKHITMDISNKRQVLSGLIYNQPPAQTEKINISQANEFYTKLSEFQGGNLEKFLLSTLYGLAATTIREVIFRSGQSVHIDRALSEAEIKNLMQQFEQFYSLKSAQPCAKRCGEAYRDFFVMPYQCCADDVSSINSCKPNSFSPSFQFFDTLNQAMDAYYTSQSLEQINNGRRNFLLSLLKNALSKSQKKLGSLLLKQQSALDFEQDRKCGDLILSNLHLIKKGYSEIEVTDYYNDNQPYRIKMDEHKTPQANAQIFYKSYNKKKTALSKLDIFIAQLNDDIEYLESLTYFAESVADEETYIEILDELVRLGLHKKKLENKKDKQPKKEQYLSTDFNGYRILIGKSSTSNDMLLRKSQPEHVWLHASAIHGSHVIIENPSQQMPPMEVITHAAQLAAFYSKAKHSQNVPVDYTFIKNVKKPRGAAPGKVVFTGQKTIFVTPLPAPND